MGHPWGGRDGWVQSMRSATAGHELVIDAVAICIAPWLVYRDPITPFVCRPGMR